jgi:cytochrome b pre-mRNA-processing protein 3
MLKKLFTRKPQAAETVYGAIVAQARRTHFYADWHVPDTVDGRFDMITLLMFAVLDRLKDEPDKTMAQHLTNVFFTDMDRSLREMGVGDLSVGKKVRKIAESFYGRIDAYRKAMVAGGTALQEAIARNVFAGVDSTHAPDLAQWLARTCAHLEQLDAAELAAGHITFAP